MAVDVATLGLEVDASGFLRPMENATAATRRLWQAAGMVDNGMVAMQGAIDRAGTKTRTFATNASFAFSSLASSGTRDITSLLRSVSSLGFMLGGAAGGVIVLGISAIADAWSETTKKAKEQQEKQLADFASFAAKFSEQSVRVRIAALESRRAQLGTQGTSGLSPLAQTWRNIQEVWVGPGNLASPAATAIQDINDEIARMNRLLAETAAEANKDALKKSLEAATKAAKAYGEAVKEALRNTHAGGMAFAFGLTNRDERPREPMFGRLSGGGIPAGPAVLPGARSFTDILKEAADALKVFRGAAIGAGTSLLRHFGGAAGGAAAGGIEAGFAAKTAGGGSMGIAFGIVNSLVGSILNMGKASREAARALQDFITQQRITAGLVTQEQVNAQAVAARYASELRKISVDQMRWNELLASGQLTREQHAAVTADLTRKTKELLDLQAAVTVATSAQTAAMNTAMQEDIAVRLLRADGRTEEAEAMALALAQQREYAQAVRDGANQTTLAALAEVQRVEKLTIAMDKIKAKIDSLTGTITGLQDFRNSLLLGDATLSPTARLTEARRQYDEILALTQGDDVTAAQNAAGRLPGAAQALLDASRGVNASGSGYQSDLAMVLADNAALIARFQDLRTIEEEMLLELQRIRDNTSVVRLIEEDRRDGIGVIEVDGGRRRGRVDVVGDADPMVTVNQAGFVALSAQLDLLVTEVQAGTRATRDVGQLLLVNSV